MRRLLFLSPIALLFASVGCDSGDSGQPSLLDDPGPNIELVRALPDTALYVYETGVHFDLRDFFVHADDAPLAFEVSASGGVEAVVTGSSLEISPRWAGGAELVVSASDGRGERLSDSLSVRVRAHPLQGDYRLVSFLDYRRIWALPGIISGSRDGWIWLLDARLGVRSGGGLVLERRTSVNFGVTGGLLVSADSGWVGSEGTAFTARMQADTLEVLWSNNSCCEQYRFVLDQ